jgi:hypothetical protein
MKYRKTTKRSLEAALQVINEKYYKGNITLDAGDKTFRLGVKSSKGLGARLGMPPQYRRIKSACFHAHGFFFDELFKIEPEAIIWSLGKKIDRFLGNWEDINIGSIANPYFFSEACKCFECLRYDKNDQERI